MSKVIWKYELQFLVTRESEEILQLPENARILDIQVQGGQPFLWALVDHHAPKVARKLVIIGTGIDDEYKDGFQYLGTVQIDKFVWHIFEDVS